MSKKAKKAAKDYRLKLKRSRKETATAQYQKWASEGKNKKSKRNALSAKRLSKVRTVRHTTPLPPWNNPVYARPGSCLYGKKFTSPKYREQRTTSRKPWDTSKEKLTCKNRQRAALSKKAA